MDTHTFDSQTVSALSQFVPESQRAALIDSLIGNLSKHYDPLTLSLILSIVEYQNNDKIHLQLVEVLKHRIDDGHAEEVATTCQHSLGLVNVLLRECADELCKIADCLADRSGLFVSNHGSYETVVTSADMPPELKTSTQYLRYARFVLNSGHPCVVPDKLQETALILLGARDKATALAAKDLVFVLIAKSGQDSVRSYIDCLIAVHDSPFHQTLGYSLWLRSMVGFDTAPTLVTDLQQSSYWTAIMTGLREGDGERRKLCLEILKLSVALAVDSDQLTLISDVEGASSKNVLTQYARFCTVFQTVVLARYTNLVVECERDLRILLSPSCQIKADWVYTLLAITLDTNMQDQNRKFIGGWILRSQLQGWTSSEKFPELLDRDFLPWVTEGHLFVSSLKQTSSGMRCLHGEKIVDFIARLFSTFNANPSISQHVIDAIFSFLLRKRNSLFAYAAVFIFEGLARAYANAEELSLPLQQMEALLDLSSWRTLPEAAGDLVTDRCCNIVMLSEARSTDFHPTLLSSGGTTRRSRLFAASRRLGLRAFDDSEAADILDQSQRDISIAAAIQKCHNITERIQNHPHPPSDKLQDILEDIWSDLEYTEYPRELLITTTATILNRHIIRAAIDGQGDGVAGLQMFLADTLKRLQALSERRSFLLAPLLTTLRDTILSVPEAIDILPVEEFIVQLARVPPDPSIDLRFEYATVNLLQAAGTTHLTERYFGKRECHGFAAYLDLISRIGSLDLKLLQALVSTLIERWRKQKVPPPTMSPWKTTLQLQVLLLCCEQLSAHLSSSELASLLDDLLFILSIEPLPRYRYLLEWMTVRILMEHSQLQSRLLLLLSMKDHHSNPKYLASLMKMSVILASSSGSDEAFASQIASVFITLSSSSKIVIRHEAQWSFPIMFDHALAKNWSSITANPAYISLDTYIRSLPRFGEPPAERIMSRFDPTRDNTLANLVEGLWTDLDSTRPPFARRQDFLELYEEDTKLNNWPRSCLDLGEPIAILSKPEPTADLTSEINNTPIPERMKPDEAIALQTKGTAYLKSILQENSSSQPQRKANLEVVASLVDNPLNLGGLSRASEIFGASTLYVKDPRVIADKDFASVAVSSHNHIDIQPLAPVDMPAWLATRKAEGWTVVGIEQTDRSVLLGGTESTLPEKTILILGSEKEGMPAMALSECDMLVEIPQRGVTRSLNVQTAAAIVLYEYGRQHETKTG